MVRYNVVEYGVVLAGVVALGVVGVGVLLAALAVLAVLLLAAGVGMVAAGVVTMCWVGWTSVWVGRTWVREMHETAGGTVAVAPVVPVLDVAPAVALPVPMLAAPVCVLPVAVAPLPDVTVVCPECVFGDEGGMEYGPTGADRADVIPFATVHEAVNYSALSGKELVALLASRGLPSSRASKAKLVARLVAAEHKADLAAWAKSAAEASLAG